MQSTNHLKERSIPSKGLNNTRSDEAPCTPNRWLNRAQRHPTSNYRTRTETQAGALFRYST